MKLFIKKTVLLASFLIAWGLINIVLDPFGYFNSSLVDINSKKSAKRLNKLMYKTFDYMNNPCENVIIGDSRSGRLSQKLLENLTNESWKKLNIGALKLDEIFDLFYLVNNRKEIKRVIIGINFNMFNEHGFSEKVSGLEGMIENPIRYIYNKDVTEASFYVTRNLLTGKNLQKTPIGDREEYWNQVISIKASHWYGKYKFPDSLYKELIAFDEFTKAHNIEVIFIIVPHHNDFHKRLIDFGLEDEERRFKKIMCDLNARVYDYDFENEITLVKLNYIDPIHYKDTIGKLIINEIFTDSLKVGKMLN